LQSDREAEHVAAQANSRLIGWMKKPRLDRGPKLNKATAQPQAMMTRGVRQLDSRDAALSRCGCRHLHLPAAFSPNRKNPVRGINASHENPNPSCA